MAKRVFRKIEGKPVELGAPSTLSEFIEILDGYSEREDNFKCYRGQRNSDWKNIPALLRPDLVDMERNEKHAVRDLISVHPNEFSSDDTMFDRLVRMQHFGLPTRLMDVSQNPLVALYFATERGPEKEETDGVVTAFAVPPEREKYFDSDAVSCIANLANMTAEEKDDIVRLRGNRPAGSRGKVEIERINSTDVILRLHQFIKSEKPHFLPIIEPIDLFKPYYVHPKMSNRRILAQAGGFIIYGLEPGRSIPYTHPIVESRIIVPKAAKKPLRVALERLGIGESTLFPELDRAANRIRSRYCADERS